MGQISRVLDEEVVESFDDYVAIGGGSGLTMAVDIGPAAIVEVVSRSGLRGRGGAGFPTGLKWQTVIESAAGGGESISIVVNGAEGEPGTFKDRELIRRNPYRVIEGALVAATAMGSPSVIIALKASFERELQRLRDAIAEIDAAGVAQDVEISLVTGPNEYLFGEETALLEVVDGRQPFPRVAPPFRRGIEPQQHAPVLVDNVETLANVANILAVGPDWFREVGTESSPGTIVCTVSGDTQRHGVAEFAMGTPLAEVIATIGGGPLEGRRHVAVATGTANALVTAVDFDTPMTYEAMARIGSGLGTGGLIVFDDSRDLVAVAQAISHFLAVESCGQCEPCKADGVAIAADLERIVTGQADGSALDELRRRVNSVAVGARCALARQQENVIGDVLVRCGPQLAEHLASEERGEPLDPVRIAPIADFVDGRFVLDDAYLAKQPDWSYDEVNSGEAPVDRLRTVPVSVTQPTRDEETSGAVAPAASETPAPSEAAEADDTVEARRDPFESLSKLHDRIREQLGDVLLAGPDDRADAAAALERDLTAYVDVTERIVHPMLQRVAAVADDTVWVAELRGLDAVDITESLVGAGAGTGEQSALLDRLANHVRKRFADDVRIVFPLLRQRLTADEQTDLADAIDEVLVAPQA